MNNTDWIPLFPLRTVLFPAGVLPLRVFETRYVDMVRERMKRDAPFGVVAIRAGAEVGGAAEPHAIGTLAHIVEWDMPELGVLQLQTRGGERFRVLETRIQPSQLLEGRIEPLPISSSEADPDSLQVCAQVLEVNCSNRHVTRLVIISSILFPSLIHLIQQAGSPIAGVKCCQFRLNKNKRCWRSIMMASDC
jgi:Lon protease-like protein